MKSNHQILISTVILAIIFISTNTYALNESETINLTGGMPCGIPDKNISFEKENFTLPPPPEMDMLPPPGFNESDTFQVCENTQNTSNESKFKETPFKVNTTEITSKDNEQQKGNDALIKWYYLLPLFLIPLLLFFLMSENTVVADAEFLQNVKAESSIFHKFRI